MITQRNRNRVLPSQVACKRAVFFFVLVSIAQFSAAHDGAMGIVKERMDLMTDLKKSSKVVAGMFKGKSEFDRGLIASTAESYVEHGVAMMDLFPDTQESRASTHTDALPAVWEDREGFITLTEEFIDNSRTLTDAAVTTDDVELLRKAFNNVSKSCLKCHEQFRRPEDD